VGFFYLVTSRFLAVPFVSEMHVSKDTAAVMLHAWPFPSRHLGHDQLASTAKAVYIA